MPLSDDTVLVLYEIYGVTFAPRTVITPGGGLPPMLNITSTFHSSVQQQLEEAIARINASESQVKRVTEIVAEYSNFALDRSSIDRDGYSFKASRNLKAVQEALYTYTGILIQMPGRSNCRINLG